MADILIRGMEMPTDCAKCKLNNDTICVLINGCVYDEGNGYTRRDDCPLIALPEGHGRLVDADALVDCIRGQNDWLSDTAIHAFIGLVHKRTPTIVPAEREAAANAREDYPDTDGLHKFWEWGGE